MTETNPLQQKYRLMDASGKINESATRGLLGGNSKAKIYGRLDCKSAIKAIPTGYDEIRVFFANEEIAIAAGYRPCGHCMRDQYRLWKAGPLEGQVFPWRTRR